MLMIAMQIQDTHLKSLLQPVDVQIKNLPSGLSPAAVLVTLHQEADQDWLLFTRRPETMRQHKGQIAFPGGKFDAEDKMLYQTALRESHEEIGLHPQDVTLIGSLPPFDTISSYYLYPFVGRFNWPYELALNPAEISEVIRVPIRHLMNPEFYRSKPVPHEGQSYRIHYYDYQAHTIWGITGYIVNQFLNLLNEKALLS